MNIEQARESVGKLVMSRHTRKLTPKPPLHGPYLLTKVTKAGYCLLDNKHLAKPTDVEPMPPDK